MNSLFTAASVASASAIPASAAHAIESDPDRVGMIARAEQIVEVLGDTYVCDGWHESFDRRQAEQFVENVRLFDYYNGDCERFKAMLEWMHDHHQSIDWLADGDPAVLICRAASKSPMAAAIGAPEDPIFAAIEHHRKAIQNYSQIVDEHCQLEAAFFDERRRSNSTGPKDAEMIASEERMDASRDAMHDVGAKLADTEPATIAGVIGMLQHYVDETDRSRGEITSFPDRLLTNGVVPETESRGDSRSPEYFVMKNVASALKRIAT